MEVQTRSKKRNKRAVLEPVSQITARVLESTVSLSQPLCLMKSRSEKQDEEEKPWLQARKTRV